MILEFHHNGQWLPVSDRDFLFLNQVEGSQRSGSLSWGMDSSPTTPFVYNENDVIGLRGRDAVSDAWIILFFGKIIDAPARVYAGNSSSDTFVAHDVWRALERTTFQLDQFVAEGYNFSHLILFRGYEGSRLTTGQQIAAVLDFSAANGISISYMQADLDRLTVEPPADEQVDLSCGEIIQKCLRWHPEVFTHMEYSESGCVIRFYSLEQEQTLQLSMASVVQDGGFSIQKNADLVLRGVVIHYEIESQLINGTTQSIKTDSAGETSGPNVLVHTVQVEGPQEIATDLTTTLVTGSIPVDYRSNLPWVQSILNDPDIIHFWDVELLVGGVVTRPIPYSSYIISGYQRGYDIVHFPAVLRFIDCKYVFSFNRGFLYKTLEKTVILTSSSDGVYTRPGDPIVVPGELIPNGVAQSIYDARRWPLHEGSCSRILPAITAHATARNNLSITGGLDEYETMRAPVQEVFRSYFGEKEQITFGHPEQSGISEFIDMLRANRAVNRPNRRTWRT